MTSQSDYHISYDHPGPEADRKRAAAHALHVGTLLPFRPCPTCGEMLTIWAEEENADSEATQRQVECELAEIGRYGCGHRPDRAT